MAIQRSPWQPGRISFGAALAVSIVATLALQGCASSPTPEGGAPASASAQGASAMPTATAQSEAGVLAGTIESVRSTWLDDAGGRRAGLALDVRLDNGERRTIMQEADEGLRPGERIRLITGDGAERASQ